MNLKLVFSYGLFFNVYAKVDNNFLIDYFKYKIASSVVGITCNMVKDDLLLLKEFSRDGITAAVSKLDDGSEISVLASANYWKIGVFVDTSCYDTKLISSVFLDASDYRMFGELHYWLILGSDLDDVLRIIDDQAFGLSTDLVIAVPSNDTEGQYDLYDIYNMSKERGNALNITFFGTWKDERGLNIELLQMKFMRRSNLHGSIIKAAYFKLNYRPADMALEEYFNDYQNATKDAMIKFGFHIMSHLADLYNFRLENYECAKWLPGDQYGPLVRSIMSNTAEFMGNPLTMTIQRTYLFKYVHQDWPFRTCFIFRNPQPTTIKVEEILRPFTNMIWYSMVVFVIISVMILVATFRFEAYDTVSVRISNSILLTVGALCQQGTQTEIKRLSTRIAFLFIMIFSLLMYNYYSALVVSARLGEPIFKINDSLNEFGKLKMKMASESMTYLEFFLKKPDWETVQFHQNYWLKLSESEKIMEPAQGIQLVKEGGFAYHSHPDVSYPFIEKSYDNHEICELMEVHLARPTHTAFGVRSNSSFVEMARVGLTKISEVGLTKRQVTRWQFRKPKCRKDILSASSINIYEFAPHLLLLVIGMLMAIVFGAIEILIVNHGVRVQIKMALCAEHLLSKPTIKN